MATSPIAGKRLRDIGFPTGSIVGAVLAQDQVVMPHGDLLINVGDILVVFAVRDAVRQVAQHRIQVQPGGASRARTCTFDLVPHFSL